MQESEADFTFDEEPSSAVRRLALPVGLTALFIFVLFSSCYVINEQSVGIVSRFGRHVRTSRPGICVKLPWPFESVRKQNVTEIVTLPLGCDQPIEFLSSDGFPLRLAAQLRYKVDPANIHQYLFNAESTESILTSMAAAVLREAVSSLAARDALASVGPIQANAETALEQLIGRYPIGVQLVGLEIEHLGLPQGLALAAEAEAEAEKEAAAIIDRADEYRRQKAADADHAAAAILGAARLEAEKRIIRAKADAERFDALLAEYEKDPHTVKRVLYLDALRRLLPAARSVVIEDAAEPSTKGGSQ